MDELPFSLAFGMVKESFAGPAILFYLASDANKNKRQDHLKLTVACQFQPILQVIGKVSSRVEIRDLSSKRVTGMSSLRTHTPHRIAHKSLQVRRRGKLRKNMAARIGDA